MTADLDAGLGTLMRGLDSLGLRTTPTFSTCLTTGLYPIFPVPSRTHAASITH